MSKSDWSRHNLWNLLTINLKNILYRSFIFYRSIDWSGFYLQVCITSVIKLFFLKKKGEPLLYWKIMWGYMFTQHLETSGLKLIKILDLTKMRTVWLKKPVSWSIIWELECCQFEPLLSTLSRLNLFMKLILTFK